MRALQTAHEAAAIAAQANVAGAGVLPARHPAKLNGDRRRTDAYVSPKLQLEQSEPAEPPPPSPRPQPRRGRRATDRRPTAFPHPSQLKPQSPFMAQLMSQDQPQPAAVGGAEAISSAPPVAAKPLIRIAESDLVDAQRRHFEQVNAYRRTVNMATDFIIRRYHLATDVQGLMINDFRTVEMVV